MAKQTVGIGTEPNDNTGDPLRTAFDKINDNTDELYALFGDGTTLSISGDASISGGALTIANDSIEGTMLNTNSADGTTIELSSDSLSVLKVPNDLTVDDSTIALNTGTTFNGTGARTVSVKDNGITHAKLENRYTAVVTKTETSGTGGSAVDIGWDDGAVFNFSNSLTGAIELKFDAYKAGQVIDIYGLTGSQTITLNSTASGTEVFNKVGGVDYDGASSNLIQVVCVDDSASTPVFNYSIATYTSDDTP